MAYILDIAIVLIFALVVFAGHKRGFIKTLSGVLALAAALAVTILLKGPVATLVYDNTVEPAITEAVAAETQDLAQGAAELYEKLPDVVKNLLVQTGVTDGESFLAAMPASGPAQVLRPVLLPLIELLVALALFLLTYVLAKILLRVMNLVAKLPLLKQLNRSLGLVAGILSGILWVLLAVGVLQAVAAFGNADSLITLPLLEKTILIKWLAGFNPLAYIPQTEFFVLPGK